jgi:hypothetical protein
VGTPNGQGGGMTEEQVHMTLDIARRLLAESGADAYRIVWADDVIKALEHGDIAAARRIGLFDVPERRAAA